MEKRFTIHQVSELTGLSSDAIRLYEKKGLITPIRDDSNGYRYYSIDDIHRIAAVSLYRKMDIGIPEINQLFNKRNLSEISRSFAYMLEENDKRIQLLKRQNERLKSIKGTIDMLREHENKYSIAELPEYYILHHQDSVIFNYNDMKDVFCSPVYSYGNFRYVIRRESHDEYMGKSLEFVVDKSMLLLTEWGELAKNMSHTKRKKCVYTVCSKDRIDDSPWNFKKIQRYIDDNNIICEDESYAFYIHSIMADNTFKDYYEVFVPIVG